MRIDRHDIKLAARSFTRHPGFTCVAIVSLALAIALNTTMYSVIDAMVRPKTDIQDADRVFSIRIWGDYRKHVDDATRASLLRAGFNVYEAATFAISASKGTLGVEYGARFDRSRGSLVAPNYFRMLGVRPIAGRTFVDEDLTGATNAVVISDRLAASLFADGSSPLSKSIDIEGVPHPVIGIISTKSQVPGSQNDLWMLPPPGTRLDALPFNLVRLRKGIDPAVADRQLHVISAQFARLAGELPKDVWFQLIPATASQFHVRNFHYALIGAVVAVLLIACANLANLQLARGIGRSRELALRVALGATRRAIIAQLVLESAMLAIVGLVFGLVATFWAVHVLSSRIPPSVSFYVIAPQTSWRVMVFAMMACVTCVMLIGVLPAVRVSRVDPNELLKSGAGTGANRKSRQQYGVMVIVEIGLSLALLSGAALVIRRAITVNKITRTEYDLTPLTSALFLFPRYDTTVSAVDFDAHLVSHARALPDVADAAVYRYGFVSNQTISVAGGGAAPREVNAPGFSYPVVSPSYLHTLQISIAAGRDFVEGAPSESEVIIDKATARFLWPGLDPIGKQIKLGDSKSPGPWIHVVGVTAASTDVSGTHSLNGIEANAPHLGAIYYSPGRRDSFSLNNKGTAFRIVVRSKADHDRMPITLERNFWQIGPIRLLGADRMEVELGIRDLRQSQDFIAGAFTAFAALALALAALGIYGIVAHAVAERRRELGVRIALGATGKNILHAVLREGNAVALAGVALGLLFTKYTMVWLAAFTSLDDRYDAPLFTVLAFTLFAVAVLSALIPALRATRIDPVESLRSE